jgi:hypothetical protein
MMEPFCHPIHIALLDHHFLVLLDDGYMSSWLWEILSETAYQSQYRNWGEGGVGGSVELVLVGLVDYYMTCCAPGCGVI